MVLGKNEFLYWAQTESMLIKHLELFRERLSTGISLIYPVYWVCLILRLLFDGIKRFFYAEEPIPVHLRFYKGMITCWLGVVVDRYPWVFWSWRLASGFGSRWLWILRPVFGSFQYTGCLAGCMGPRWWFGTLVLIWPGIYTRMRWIWGFLGGIWDFGAACPARLMLYWPYSWCAYSISGHKKFVGRDMGYQTLSRIWPLRLYTCILLCRLGVICIM